MPTHGLSDHDAQMQKLHVGNLNNTKNKYKTSPVRKIDFNTINEFKDKLSTDRGFSVLSSHSRRFYT
jgi:hypothetical protein